MYNCNFFSRDRNIVFQGLGSTELTDSELAAGPSRALRPGLVTKFTQYMACMLYASGPGTAAARAGRAAALRLSHGRGPT